MASDEPLRFILFLPPLPTPPTLASLKSAFGDTLSQVLKECASQSASSSSAAAVILEIAVASPDLINIGDTPRAALYSSAQTTLAAVYKLVCIIAARDSVNVEDADGVDVRVLLVAWSPEPNPHPLPPAPTSAVVDLPTLASSGRQWAYAFGVESDAGEAFVRAFVAAKQQPSKPEAPATSSTTATSAARSDVAAPAQQQHHSHVAVGGTFDHLHIGHKLLLHMTLFSLAPAGPGTATIGITGDALLANKRHAAHLEAWATRQRRVAAFLLDLVAFTPPTIARVRATEIHLTVAGPRAAPLQIRCVEIQDAYGPTITDAGVSALVVSGETRGGGAAVNVKRRELGWPPLEVFEVDVLDARDDDDDDDVPAATGAAGFADKISSTAIREKLARQSAGASGEDGAGGR
nr:uncharacterized protein c1f12.08 [Quercus suber]